MTHYDILGVPHNATFEQIKKGYREQVRFFHPDVFDGSKEVAKLKTQQLNEAYEILSNPDKRAAYDSTIIGAGKKVKEESDSIIADIESLKKKAEEIKIFAKKELVDDFIILIYHIHHKIYDSNLSNELKVNLNVKLCYVARNLSITLHSNGATELAYDISSKLFFTFDRLVPLEMLNMLRDDFSTLQREKAHKEYIQQMQAREERKKRIKGILVIAAIIIIVAHILISAFIEGSRMTNNTTSTGEPQIEKTEETTEETETVTDIVFSDDAAVGTRVYADIVSIYPAIGISDQGYYTAFVCACKTSSGANIWMLVDVDDYRGNFEFGVSTSVFGVSTSIYNEHANTIKLSPPARVYGTVKAANSVMSALSSKINASTLIDFSSKEVQ